MREDLPFRYRWSCQVLYGHLTDFMTLQQRKVEVAQARGWGLPRFWVATAGNLNDFAVEREYETLESLAKELNERQKDLEFMKLMRESYTHLVQGSVRTELLESVESRPLVQGSVTTELLDSLQLR